MKVYLNENKLSLLKESQDEVTFYGFFTQVKNFMKELLKGNVTAEPSQELKNHGLGQKELISKLKKQGLLKSDENINEVPNEDDETKLRARHTITYSVPKRDFEKKFHRLYSELFENEWKPKSVLSNEKEEIQKILDNDTDGAYKNRGGYKIQENSSQIETYYHGGDLNDDIWYSKVLWLTPQDYYAKEYAKHQEHTNPVVYEVKIDESKLNTEGIYGMDDLEGGNGSFDPYDPNIETIELAKKEGINCYWMDYDSYNAEGLCLFTTDPIVSIRQLSQEEFDNIEDWNEELDESVNLQENHVNEDYPLYHFTTIENLEKIAEDGYKLHSSSSDGPEAICFTRSMKEIDYEQINDIRDFTVIITLTPSKLKMPKGLKLTQYNYGAAGFSDEFEERIVNKDKKNQYEEFSLDIRNAIERIDISMSRYRNWGEKRKFENIIKKSQDLYTKLHFYATPYGFLSHNNEYNPKEILMYFDDFFQKGQKGTRAEWRWDGLARANAIDRAEAQKQEEERMAEQGFKYVQMLKKIITEFHQKINLFTSQKETWNCGHTPRTLYLIYQFDGLTMLYNYLCNINNKEEFITIYKWLENELMGDKDRRISTTLSILNDKAKQQKRL